MSWCDFDGTELFEGFWMKFSIFAERFNWSSSDMAFYLVTSLRGKALEYVSYLPHRDLYNVSVLYSALKSRFGDIETAQICRMKLRNITMFESESVQEYVCRTEINVRKSFPGVNEDLLVKLITEYAIYGYPDGNIGYRVLTKEPSTVSELIKEILWQEHCRQSLKSVEKSRCTADSDFEKHFEIGTKRNMNFTEHDIRGINNQKLGKDNYTVGKLNVRNNFVYPSEQSVYYIAESYELKHEEFCDVIEATEFEVAKVLDEEIAILELPRVEKQTVVTGGTEVVIVRKVELKYEELNEIVEATEVAVAKVSKLMTTNFGSPNVEQQTIPSGEVEVVSVRKWTPIEQSDVQFDISKNDDEKNYDKPRVSTYTGLSRPVYGKDFTYKELVRGNGFTQFRDSNIYENSYTRDVCSCGSSMLPEMNWKTRKRNLS
ncbi:unnamed protein product [Mytilus edulis]|uniref:Paraneoplastic antigen Ma-like C-terminal domain-containing protein n=1 Tax=Mytilus edulis TaxID=6550 RepID=A0A8S3PQF2_MYTED|nr:unnamed protein product [Mytilus edulis]